MEDSCLCINDSCMEDVLHGRLHTTRLQHPSRSWHAHHAIGIAQPWISCCGNAGKNGESGGGAVELAMEGVMVSEETALESKSRTCGFFLA